MMGNNIMTSQQQMIGGNVMMNSGGGGGGGGGMMMGQQRMMMSVGQQQGMIRGQQVMGEGVLRLNMPNIDQLENKIREAESKMSIRPGEAFVDQRWHSFFCRNS